MPIVCWTTTKRELVDGTGRFVQDPGRNWNGHAFTSKPAVDVFGSWRFAFTPVAHSTFTAGVYDKSLGEDPRIRHYQMSVEFKINKFRARYYASVTGYSGYLHSAWVPWSPGERIALQGEWGVFRMFKDGTEIWSESPWET